MQSEAKTYIGSMNRAQQAYYLENGDFATEARMITIADADEALSVLGLGITPNTENYSYAIADYSPPCSHGSASFQYCNAFTKASLRPMLTLFRMVRLPLSNIKVAVKVGVTVAGGDATTLALLCEALNPPISNEGENVRCPDPQASLASRNRRCSYLW